ncbi:site-specific integrase [Acholeplasma vituli]|uniref:Site-specific integrase n=1 Tax=Paracholeplasma vituli TaxID=69473 RepID=A0ABT2PUW8_9MOLU|nr:site-specific integrase [Paracholeplasma vituli]MCU0104727.1 site-specific integrase [Paracholeplasma vituli]
MNVSKALLEYHLLTSATLKPSSIFIQEYYVKHLTHCLKDLKIKKLNQITINTGYHIVDWYRKNTKNHNNSINKNIRFLKSVMKHYEVNTSFQKFKLLPSDTKPFKRLFHEDLKLIIQYLLQMEYSKNSIVYRTAILLLLDSGVRISELLDIKIRNIDFDLMRIYLETTKNGKVRYAPFSEFSRESIIEIIRMNNHSPFLFWNFLQNRPLTKSDMKNFYRRLKRWTQMDRLHSHRFRKTFGSLLAENGMAIQHIQKMLDHSRVTTTMIYIEHDKDKAFEEYQNYNNWKIA